MCVTMCVCICKQLRYSLSYVCQDGILLLNAIKRRLSLQKTLMQTMQFTDHTLLRICTFQLVVYSIALLLYSNTNLSCGFKSMGYGFLLFHKIYLGLILGNLIGESYKTITPNTICFKTLGGVSLILDKCMTSIELYLLAARI